MVKQLAEEGFNVRLKFLKLDKFHWVNLPGMSRLSLLEVPFFLFGNAYASCFKALALFAHGAASLAHAAPSPLAQREVQ